MLYTVLAVVAGLVTYRECQRFREATDRLRLGIEGERAVGDILQELTPLGYRVFHDILCDGFNIDHALIGPTGVYAIETKARSKTPGAGDVVYDGIAVLVGGHSPDRDPVAQAEANARTLAQILKKQTGQEHSVRGVVLFPGWFVKVQARRPNVWVLNPLMLRASLRHEKHRLTDAQINALGRALAQYQETEQRVRRAKAE